MQCRDWKTLRKSEEIWPRKRHIPKWIISEIVWWGLRKGRSLTNESSARNKPATLWMRVVSKDSSKVIRGSIPGSLLASILLPDPGGPIIRIKETLVSGGFKSYSFRKITSNRTVIKTRSDFARMTGIGPMHVYRTSRKLPAQIGSWIMNMS